MAMVLVDWALALWMKACAPTAQVYAFVDDWNFVLRHLDHFDVAWGALEQFTRMLDLEIDERKTHAWAAQASDRKILKVGRHKRGAP